MKIFRPLFQVDATCLRFMQNGSSRLTQNVIMTWKTWDKMAYPIGLRYRNSDAPPKKSRIIFPWIAPPLRNCPESIMMDIHPCTRDFPRRAKVSPWGPSKSAMRFWTHSLENAKTTRSSGSHRPKKSVRSQTPYYSGSEIKFFT